MACYTIGVYDGAGVFYELDGVCNFQITLYYFNFILRHRFALILCHTYKPVYDEDASLQLLYRFIYLL